ncbi:secreted RxLR effector protein 161-like [Primulina eburnea]|uniref:secreted RxLR effector protein 161-like n=1 Tax=Primulina eburnea TaxID=1245227 RepID=UPI003C6C6980
MEVARSKNGISVAQRKYTLDLLKEAGMLGCKPVDIPMDPNLKLRPRTTEQTADKGRFQRLVGKLIYLAHSRPDITFAVSMVSRFMNDPSEIHMQAVMRILRYLKASPGSGILFRKTPSRHIDIYTDADYGGSVSDRRSTSGMCTYVWGNLVTWRSKKQSVVARSSAEAELRSLAHGVCEGIWLERLLRDLQISVDGPIRMLCDNQASISMSQDPVTP